MSVLIMCRTTILRRTQVMPFRHSDPCILIHYAAIPAWLPPEDNIGFSDGFVSSDKLKRQTQWLENGYRWAH